VAEADSSLFWWSWGVQLAIAAGTIGAVVVALFGQALRSKFFPPRLNLALVRPEGELTRFLTGSQVRYYHLRVSNSRRWSPAQGVQVVLLQLEEPAADGSFRIAWRGDMPLGWRHQSLFPVARTIGAEADVDLCSVTEEPTLQLHPLLVPFNLQATRKAAVNWIVTVQARGDEADSPPLRIKIAWDGTWNQGESEMRQHLVVQTAT
jgi:hypothetical protein